MVLKLITVPLGTGRQLPNGAEPQGGWAGGAEQLAGPPEDVRRGASPTRPGGNPGVNLKSISHRCYLFEVAFVWELTKETIVLPLGCLQGGMVGANLMNAGASAGGHQGVELRGSQGQGAHPHLRELFFIDNLLVRIHFIIVMIRWTGLTPWEVEFPFRWCRCRSSWSRNRPALSGPGNLHLLPLYYSQS